MASAAENQTSHYTLQEHRQHLQQEGNNLLSLKCSSVLQVGGKWTYATLMPSQLLKMFYFPASLFALDSNNSLNLNSEVT